MTVDAGTETTPRAMLGLAVDLLARVAQAAELEVGRLQVLGVGVAGLGESGVLLDATGKPCAPVIAWFDQRGARQVQRVGERAANLPELFARRTGLPWDCQSSLAKLLWLASCGLTLTPAHYGRRAFRRSACPRHCCRHRSARESPQARYSTTASRQLFRVQP